MTSPHSSSCVSLTLFVECFFRKYDFKTSFLLFLLLYMSLNMSSTVYFLKAIQSSLFFFFFCMHVMCLPVCASPAGQESIRLHELARRFVVFIRRSSIASLSQITQPSVHPCCKYAFASHFLPLCPPPPLTVTSRVFFFHCSVLLFLCSSFVASVH